MSRIFPLPLNISLDDDENDEGNDDGLFNLTSFSQSAGDDNEDILSSEAILSDKIKAASELALLERNELEDELALSNTNTSKIMSPPNSSRKSTRDEFAFEVPKFVEDAEDGSVISLDDDGSLDNDSYSGIITTRKGRKKGKANPEEKKETETEVSEFDIEPDNMTESHRDRGPSLKDRYFGADARMLFYDRLKFLMTQRYNMVWEDDQDIDSLYFDNEDNEKHDYPFIGDEEEDEEEEENKVGIEHSILHALTGGDSFSLQSASSKKTYKSKYADDFPNPRTALDCPVSPRTKFLAGCIKAKMNPRASLILRKKLGKDIDISHMCIGNDIAILLAECLGELPYIESLNINNNNLLDEGVAAILTAIQPIKTLKKLNISRNKMDDDAADALAEYVQMEDCPCESLIMQVSDVDDFEGERFVRQLMNNRSITEIDLSDNLLGRAENMRTVIPDMCTCTEAFAEMLENKDCILKSLTLAWNTIRNASCISLVKSLRDNCSLTHLDISFNSLSFDGGEALGDALLENTSLIYLNIASNAINASACFTISMGVIENKALKHVILDNNPIGEAGAQALMLVPINVGSRCKVSAEKCNTGLQDPRCWFAHSNPLGVHKLKLDNPYERAVAFALLHHVANHATHIFVDSRYEDPHGRIETLNLKQAILTGEKEKYFDDRQMSIVQGLQKMRDAAGDRERGIALFHEADEDGGGSLDGEELTDLLTSVGMDVTPDMIDDIMDLYDIDGQGAIGMPEFLAFLKTQYNESVQRLAEMTDERIMAADQRPNSKYMPPRNGTLHLIVMDGFTRKEKYGVVSSCDQDYAKQVSSDASTMLGFAVSNSKIRFGEAITMFNTMYGDGGQKAYILADLVVKLADPMDCRKLVQKITKGDKTQINLLKQAMGGCYKPYLGILNGYYQLDLSKEMDRIALTRLLEQSQTDNTRRQGMSPVTPGRMGDTSQCGNWTSFRNEYLNGRRFAVQPDKFRPMPKSGKLTFDYSMTGRPIINDDFIILSDRRCVKILYNLFLIKEEEMDLYLKKMTIWRNDLRRASTANGKMKMKYEYDKEKGLAIGEAVATFYENLNDRHKLYSAGYIREMIKVNYSPKKKKKKKKGKNKKKYDGDDESKDGNKNKGVSIHDDEGEDEDEVAEQKEEQDTARKSVSDDHGGTTADADGEGEGDGATGEGEEGQEDKEEEGEESSDDDEEEEVEVKREHKLTEEMAKYKTLIESPLVQDEAKGARIVEMLEDTFSHAWLLCRHLAAIILSFPCGSSMRTDYFGSYHVDLIVSLFNRVVDIHNFEIVMKVLNPQECAQVYCRIGWLNIFNPTKPEGYFVVDFNRYEERLVGKMLIALAITEPGDNMLDYWFRWSWDMDVVPGWELTEGYKRDETCTLKGIMMARYYSGEGKGKTGCAAHVRLRKAMYSLVLSSEDVASCDLDEKFPYLAHGSGDTSSDEERANMTKEEAMRNAIDKERDEEEEEQEGKESSVSNNPLDAFRIHRHKLKGEMYLEAQGGLVVELWDQLLVPPEGIAERNPKLKKNPLALIFQAGVMEEAVVPR